MLLYTATTTQKGVLLGEYSVKICKEIWCVECRGEKGGNHVYTPVISQSMKSIVSKIQFAKISVSVYLYVCVCANVHPCERACVRYALGYAHEAHVQVYYLAKMFSLFRCNTMY